MIMKILLMKINKVMKYRIKVAIRLITIYSTLIQADSINSKNIFKLINYINNIKILFFINFQFKLLKSFKIFNIIF